MNYTTIQLYSLDAYTEVGDVFDYNNPETSPQQHIHRLMPITASVLFKSSVLPIAEARIGNNNLSISGAMLLLQLSDAVLFTKSLELGIELRIRYLPEAEQSWKHFNGQR